MWAFLICENVPRTVVLTSEGGSRVLVDLDDVVGVHEMTPGVVEIAFQTRRNPVRLLETFSKVASMVNVRKNTPSAVRPSRMEYSTSSLTRAVEEFGFTILSLEEDGVILERDSVCRFLNWNYVLRTEPEHWSEL